MQHTIAALFCFLFFSQANAQEIEAQADNPSDYYNNFQKYVYNSPNADSACYFVRKLAANEKYALLLSDLMHNSFALSFAKRKYDKAFSSDSIISKSLFYRKILIKIFLDTNKALHAIINPLYLWVKIQDNSSDVKMLKRLTNEFIKTELSRDLFTNRIGRYGLLIFQIISSHEELRSLSDKLFDAIYPTLAKNQIPLTDSSTRAQLEERAWYRYLFASANFMKASQMNDMSEKEKYLKYAFNYSPDMLDKNYYASYFYDMNLLFGSDEKATFKIDYLEFLTSTSYDKQKILDLFLEAALIDPQYKNKVKVLYNSYNKSAISFDEYWRNAINEKAKTAFPVSLALLDREIFSTKQNAGNWMVIDFWGTWCVACRSEHVQVQMFYDSVVLKNPNNIQLLTIACSDTKEKVLAYMQEKHFSFPVAMSDGLIENIYSVQGYPTKLLITPEGKYIIIPYGTEWIDFVKQYCNL